MRLSAYSKQLHYFRYPHFVVDYYCMYLLLFFNITFTYYFITKALFVIVYGEEFCNVNV